MEFNLNKQSVFINDTILDTVVEQPIECDVLLPDTHRDIGKILKCTLTPAALNQMVQAGQLIVDGSAQVLVHYATASGRLCSTKYQVPFSKTVPLPTGHDCLVTTVHPSCDYVSCRSVNSRRMDIRGAVSLKVHISSCCQEEVVSNATGCGIQLKKHTRAANRVLCQANKSFTLTEELELSHGKPAIEQIIRVNSYARLTDSKVVAGKVLIKGEANLHILYDAEEGGCQTMQYSLPINQMLDADGLDENCLCYVELCIASESVDPRCDEDGEARILAVQLGISAKLVVHKPYKVECVGDCFSTKYPCTHQKKNINTMELISMLDHNFLYKDDMELPTGVDNILDVWGKVISQNVTFQGDNICITGKMCLSLFARMQDDCTEYFEKVVDFDQTIPLPQGCKSPSLCPQIKCVSCAYSITDASHIALRCEIVLSGCLYSHGSFSVIGEIDLDQRAPKAITVQRGLYIYMGENGEELWDIAKRYNTSVSRIAEENQLECEQGLTGRTMLLVPVL